MTAIKYNATMRHKSAKFWIIGVAAIVVLGAAVLGYSLYFANRAAPNVTIAGQSITGMTKAEATSWLQQRVDATQVKVTLDGKETDVPLADLGYFVDVPKTVEQALSDRTSFVGQLKALFSKSNVEPVVTTNDEAQSGFQAELLTTAGEPATNAKVELQQNKFTVIPGQAGVEVDTKPAVAAAATAAKTLTTQTVALTTVPVEPTITTEAAQQVADDANRIVNLPIALTTTLNIYSPTPEQKAAWVKIPAPYQGQSEADTVPAPKVEVDQAAVTKWVTDTTTASNDEPQPGVRNVNVRGDVVAVVSDGESGWTANNVEALTKGVLQAVNSRTEYSQEITYDEVKNTEWTDQLIAPGSESLAYQAAPGEKWIDINLSNFTTTAYEGATPVRGPVYMVPGAPQMETVTGRYKIWLKVPSQTMRGTNLDGSTYETPDVPWAMYFHGDYALHGAYWRSSFGYGGPAGSHGCVNMPVDEAKWFYDWAPVGTTVVSHY